LQAGHGIEPIVAGAGAAGGGQGQDHQEKRKAEGLVVSVIPTWCPWCLGG
jgi:hypothetical protein